MKMKKIICEAIFQKSFVSVIKSQNSSGLTVIIKLQNEE